MPSCGRLLYFDKIMNEQKHYQEMFFNYLLESKKPEVVLEKTMNVLNIKKGAAYKRMNGDTALTTSELIKLSQHFDVSLDTAFGSGQYVSFKHPFAVDNNCLDFLDSLVFYLGHLPHKEKSRLTYLANELPVFYYFDHSYIFNFLLSIWNHLHWKNNTLKISRESDVDAKLQFLRGEVSRYYNEYPVTEIWNSNMFANLYQQIIFCITVRAFENVRFIQLLVEDVQKLQNRLRELAVSGMKDVKGVKNPIELKIYLNEFGNYLNVVNVESEQLKATFVGFDIPQFIVSHNATFFQFSKDWIEKIRHRSILISGDGFQHRELFFQKLDQDFSNFSKTVDKLIGVYYPE